MYILQAQLLFNLLTNSIKSKTLYTASFPLYCVLGDFTGKFAQ